MDRYVSVFMLCLIAELVFGTSSSGPGGVLKLWNGFLKLWDGFLKL